MGATIMNGPMLAGITQSFLDALNHGAVPTITSSWQVSIQGKKSNSNFSCINIFSAFCGLHGG